MDFEHLRRKGWSEAELHHAQQVMQGTKPHEHLSLWALTLLLVAGSIGISFFLMPLVLFLHALTIPVSFLLGLCVGMLLIHALRSLRMARNHHLRAALFLAGASFIATLLATSAFSREVAFFGSAEHALFVSIPYVFGILTPYFAERRLHGSREQSPQERSSMGARNDVSARSRNLKTGGFDGTA